MRMLEESLRRLQTDHLDLWQIHEVVYVNDSDLIFAPNAQSSLRVYDRASNLLPSPICLLRYDSGF